MRVFTSNKKIILSFSVVAFMFLFSTILGTYAVFKSFVVLKKTSNDQEMIIIIDPGHGGLDGGAAVEHEPGKLIIEKSINLSISLRLKQLLRLMGYRVIMTRETDKSIHDSDIKRTRQQKNSDLNNRLKIINQNLEKKSILVSIHQNKFPNDKQSGTQIFFSEKNPKSETLGFCIRDVIVKKLQPNNKRELKPATSKIFLLNKSQIPSVTVECGFLSNREEGEKLNTEEYQSEMSMSIFCGILNFIHNQDDFQNKLNEENSSQE